MGPGFGGFSGGCLGLGGGFGMMFIGILVIGLIIYLVLKGQNNQNGISSNNTSSSNANALDIAKNRLAKGEITAEEFENIKKTLI